MKHWVNVCSQYDGEPLFLDKHLAINHVHYQILEKMGYIVTHEDEEYVWISVIGYKKSNNEKTFCIHRDIHHFFTESKQPDDFDDEEVPT